MRTFSYLFLFFMVFTMSCSSTTKMTGSWANQEALKSGKKYKQIFVSAIVDNIQVRQSVEATLANEVQSRGLMAVKSVDHFPPSFTSGTPPTKEELLNVIRATGSDAILTVTVKDKGSETHYVPGTTTYAPYPSYGYYGSYYGYYGYHSAMYSTPGYYTTDKYYFLETNLYDAQTEQILWSGQSETLNPGSLEQFNRDYILALVTAMKKDGIIRSEKKK
ncbi:MAG: hypothetical protein IT270_20945 [Saprospiraceae bacterium]|nr:hypothetical protein [Saprospiraceae bacterium]